MKPIAKLIALLLLLSTAPACAALLSALPEVVSKVADAMLIIDQIETFTDAYFMAAPNPKLEATCREKITQARSALITAQRATQGAEDLSAGDVDKAFADFREAYTALLVVVGPLGVQTGDGGALSASSSGVLTVPTPMALEQ